MTPEEIDEFNNSPKETCISVLRVKMKQFKIEMFKNYVGNQTLKLKFSNFILKKISKLENSSLGLKGQIKVKYYNKRKGFYEPLVEPWIFHLSNLKVNSDSNIKISNFEKPGKDKENMNNVSQNELSTEHLAKNHTHFKELESIISHRNSLNINLSTAFVETAIEATQAFKSPNEQRDPYKIVNKLGYGLLFLLNDNKKIFIEELIMQLVSKNRQKDYLPAQLALKTGDEVITKSKQLRMNFIILKETKETQIKKKVREYIDSLSQQQLHQSTKSPQPLKATISGKQIPKPFMSSQINNNSSSVSTFVLQDSVNESKSGAPLDMNSLQLSNQPSHQQKHRQKILVSQNFSDFRTISAVSLDRIGKQFFLLENLNAFSHSEDEQQKQQQQTKQPSSRENKTKDNTKNQLHQSGQDFFVLNISSDPGSDRKLVNVQSSVSFYNNLSLDIIVCFLKPDPNQAQDDPENLEQLVNKYISADYQVIRKNSSLALPLNFLLEKRDVYFKLAEKWNVIKSGEKRFLENENQQESHKDFTIFKMSDLIKIESFYQDYESVDDLKLTEIIGAPNEELITDKNNRIIHKQMAIVKQRVIVGNKKNEEKWAYFQLSIVKTKQTVANSRKSDVSSNRTNNSTFCFETSIIINPFVRILNATIEDLFVSVGKESIQLKPDDSFIPYYSELESCETIKLGHQQNKMQTFTYSKTKSRESIRIEAFNEPYQFPVFIHIEHSKVSRYSQILTLFTPFVLLNRSGLPLYFKETQKQHELKEIHKKLTPIEKDKQSAQEQQINSNNEEGIFSPTRQKLHLNVSARERTSLLAEEVIFPQSLMLFSPAVTTNKMQIAFASRSPTWSQSISLSQKNHFGIAIPKGDDKLYEVNISVDSGQGRLFRTEIITVTPKYYFFNQTEHNLVLSQESSKKLQTSQYFRLPMNQDKAFYWPQKNKQQIAYLSFYSRDFLGKDFVFSNPFKIDEINNFAVKVPYKDVSLDKYKYGYITISITLQSGVFCIRFLEKGQPPPYVIQNKTPHEIFIQQYIPSTTGGCCSKRGRQLAAEKKVIFPKQRVIFTWDHWIIDFDKQLSVEIQNQHKVYNLEKLKDYEPIYLQGQDQYHETTKDKKILYKKGELMICDNFKDDFQTYFCILNIYQQKLQLYLSGEKVQTVDLVYGKLELKRGGFDIVTSKQKRLNVKLSNSTSTISLYQWYLALYHSIQVNMPDKVDVKIEPRNGTMEITFYQQKRYAEMKKSSIGNQGLLNFDEDGMPFQITRTNYELSIKNMIGISLIDDSTCELFAIQLKNMKVIYQIEEKFIREENEHQQQYINNSNSNQQPQQQLQPQQMNPISQTEIQINTSEQNGNAITESNAQLRQIVKHVTKSFLQFSLENIFINNQDIHKSQYPVIFASDVRKTGDKPTPFIFISAGWKNVKNKSEEIKSPQIDQEMQETNLKLSKHNSNNHPVFETDNQQFQSYQLKQSQYQTQQPQLLGKSTKGLQKYATVKYGEQSKQLSSQLNSKQIQSVMMEYQQQTALPSKIQTLNLDDIAQDDGEQQMSLQDSEAEQVVEWINNLQIYLDHFEIRMDHQIISAITLFSSQLSNAMHSSSIIALDPIRKITEELLMDNLDQQLYEAFTASKNNQKKAIYFKNLSIQTISFCLTLNLTGGLNSIDYDTPFFPLAIFSEFGMELVAIDQANISLKALSQQHLYDTLPSIQQRIQKHYINQFLTELYKIFGSFEAIGNPVKLVKDISSSVSKMIYNPLKSLARGSGAQAVGDLATGAISFVQNSISGIYKAIRNITGFLMRVFSKITLHKQYLQDRSIRVNRQIKNIEDGFFIGGKNFLLILWETIYGVVYLPLEGCRQNHILGFIMGLYTSAVSIAIKPIVGLYDFMVSIADGLVNSAVYEDHVMEYRSRPPRIFENGKIENFEYEVTVGKDILRRLKEQPKTYETIKYYDEILLSKKTLLEIVLTDIRLVCAKKNTSIGFQKVLLHKVKLIKYHRKRRIFKFYYDVYPSKFLKCCKKKNPCTEIKYEKFDDHAKAIQLIRHLKEHFKAQQIPVKIFFNNN